MIFINEFEMKLTLKNECKKQNGAMNFKIEFEKWYWEMNLRDGYERWILKNENKLWKLKMIIKKWKWI